MIDPQKESKPVVVLAGDEADANELRDKLARVGIDNVAGYVTGLEELPRDRTIVIHCQTGPRASATWSNWRAATRAGRGSTSRRSLRRAERERLG